MIQDILIIMAISNLITEQQIARRQIIKWFKPENYLGFSGYKRFFYDLLSCWTCLTVWLAPLYLLVSGAPIGLQYINITLISMLLVDIIQKLKR